MCMLLCNILSSCISLKFLCDNLYCSSDGVFFCSLTTDVWCQHCWGCSRDITYRQRVVWGVIWSLHYHAAWFTNVAEISESVIIFKDNVEQKFILASRGHQRNCSYRHIQLTPSKATFLKLKLWKLKNCNTPLTLNQNCSRYKSQGKIHFDCCSSLTCGWWIR